MMRGPITIPRWALHLALTIVYAGGIYEGRTEPSIGWNLAALAVFVFGTVSTALIYLGRRR